MGYSARTRRATFPANRPSFYYITDRKQLAGGGIEAHIRSVVEWGADFVQIREKDLPDRELYLLVRKSVEISCGTKCRILVNGRADIALSAGAHGVHLPSNSFSPTDIRPWAPGGFIIGVSVHSRQEATRAESAGADYLILGPVFSTPSKAAYGSPLGLHEFRNVCKKTTLPVFGLGGIDAARVRPVLEAGATGIAGIRLFQYGLVRLGRRDSQV